MPLMRSVLLEGSIRKFLLECLMRSLYESLRLGSQTPNPSSDAAATSQNSRFSIIADVLINEN